MLNLSHSENLLKTQDLFNSFKIKSSNTQNQINGICENIQNQLNNSMSSIFFQNNLNNQNSQKDANKEKFSSDLGLQPINNIKNDDSLQFCGKFMLCLKGLTDLVTKLDFYHNQEQEKKNYEILNMRHIINNLEKNQIKYKLIIQ